MWSRDRHPSTTRPTARSLPLGARATGRQGGASTPFRSHSPRTSSARLVDQTATGATRRESHSVTSPHWTKACSYADQFPTRYFVLYFRWTFDLMSRSCTPSGHGRQKAYSCLVAAEGLCTNAARLAEVFLTRHFANDRFLQPRASFPLLSGIEAFRLKRKGNRSSRHKAERQRRRFRRDPPHAVPDPRGGRAPSGSPACVQT